MGAGSSNLVNDTAKNASDAEAKEYSRSRTRPDAWADLVGHTVMFKKKLIQHCYVKRCCEQDQKLRAGSVARTKERIQCICEGERAYLCCCANKSLVFTRPTVEIHVMVYRRAPVRNRKPCLSEDPKPFSWPSFELGDNTGMSHALSIAETIQLTSNTKLTLFSLLCCQ